MFLENVEGIEVRLNIIPFIDVAFDMTDMTRHFCVTVVSFEPL